MKRKKSLNQSPFYISPEHRPVVHGPKRQAKMVAEKSQEPLAS